MVVISDFSLDLLTYPSTVVSFFLKRLSGGFFLSSLRMINSYKDMNISNEGLQNLGLGLSHADFVKLSCRERF